MIPYLNTSLSLCYLTIKGHPFMCHALLHMIYDIHQDLALLMIMLYTEVPWFDKVNANDFRALGFNPSVCGNSCCQIFCSFPLLTFMCLLLFSVSGTCIPLTYAMLWYFFINIFNDLWRKVFLCCVECGGIVYHFFLSFLFIMYIIQIAKI